MKLNFITLSIIHQTKMVSVVPGFDTYKSFLDHLGISKIILWCDLQGALKLVATNLLALVNPSQIVIFF